MVKKGIERGQSITFRVPSDTPDYLLKQLSRLKETERRNFSSTIASYVLKGVNESFSKNQEVVTIPLPKKLTKEQKSWLKHEHSEAMIGTILYHLLNDPMRATTLLSSLNSNSSNIDEVFSFQEEVEEAASSEPEVEFEPTAGELDEVDIDMLDVHSEEETKEKEKAEADPLGDFFSSMNK
ncbi:hypothetical protein [Oceanobacillus halophilus]|uniref:Uncharacterized protein n=1 Tax=Oceanobacillus halophilus TaxID=930130 RepID=A0A495A1V6_9BACI|nr:hypothetical protein [Oceanobacillus halophilus]RKQ33465.1 hypothetical protein D8M06_09655 [Oceanobacillus halophilus]